jgi:hypothetical protein
MKNSVGKPAVQGNRGRCEIGYGKGEVKEMKGRTALTTRVTPIVLATVLSGCGSGSSPTVSPTPAPSAPAAPMGTPLPESPDEASLLDAAYRIDIEGVDAVFDLFPTERLVRVWSAVTFRMRPGQSRPLVHCDPFRNGAEVAVTLDGEGLDARRESDVRFFSYDGSLQTSVELQRDLAPDMVHRLEASYELPMNDAFGRFFTDVNDLVGRGNDALLPTLNTPHELARHVLVFRVHGAEPYTMVGSGLVATRAAAGDVQEWVLDTEREVASYTVMFYLAPAADVVVEERRLHGVDVRVLASLGGVTASAAFAELDPWLAELQSTLGPFPMPRGFSVVLTQSGGGMEYYGATISSLRALRHETFHMYFGCSTVARTYRDSWWDEAINMWYELSTDPAFAPINATYRSGIVGSRSPVTVGFDRRAYDEGARIIQAVAAELGGREAAVAFLRHLHATRSFDPFTTTDLAGEIQAWSGADFHERFQQWLYSDTAAASVLSPYDWIHEVDTTPPASTPRRDEG